jgi:fatty acid synthase subunit beta
MNEMMITHSLVKIKEHPPYIGDMENKVLLNSMARATFDPKTREYSFQGELSTVPELDTANVTAVSSALEAGGLADGAPVGVGVDQGTTASWVNLVLMLSRVVLSKFMLVLGKFIHYEKLLSNIY